MSVVEAVPVGRITEQARAASVQVHPGRVLLAVFAALFMALGWVAYQTWFAVVWSCTAVKVGWQVAQESRRTAEARGPAR